LDLLFDSLLAIGIRPIVELGLMPNVMAKEEKYVFWWKMNISSARDTNEWARLVEATVRHLTLRYGEEEVKKWYFEVWNEPNHPGFFAEHENIEAYFALYDAAAYAVKRVGADYKVGGPAPAGFAWVEDTIVHCKEKKVPLDFLSCHNYYVKGNGFDADGKARLCLYPTEKMNVHHRAFGQLVHGEGYPFLLTEWSASYSCRDRVHDSYYMAPFILEAVKRNEGNFDMFSYWVYTDIFEEITPPHTPFHGGFGLLNTQSLANPAYHAYAFLNRLGDRELACEDQSVYACRKEDEVELLLWNLAEPSDL
jgi:xylan 1,4-beta-xylosidase